MSFRRVWRAMVATAMTLAFSSGPAFARSPSCPYLVIFDLTSGECRLWIFDSEDATTCWYNDVGPC